jgi:hypothetical protein
MHEQSDLGSLLTATNWDFRVFLTWNAQPVGFVAMNITLSKAGVARVP